MDPRTKSLSNIAVEDLAKYLSAEYGQPVDPEIIREMLARGAPANPDGTVNMIEILAWIFRDMRLLERRRERPPLRSSVEGNQADQHDPPR
jgi:hypothetical protein